LPGPAAQEATVSAGALLDRLERVKQTGSGRWFARCPAHEDRSPSLSVRELDDGRLLLHCFGGCEVGDVLAAVGLSLADLFPNRLWDHHYPASRSRIPAADLLAVISAEVTVVAIVAADMLQRKAISGADWDRLSSAVARIGRAKDHAYGR
jgi:hypothetical protein